MNVFYIFLMSTTFLCSMVGGFLLAFAIVVMPGIRNLSDKEFIKTFQVIDKVIQDRQPIFMIIWIGSIITLIITFILSFQEIEGFKFTLMILSLLINLLGVHIPTMIINIPLNNRLQSFDIYTENEKSCNTARENFELQWNRWNVIRTIFSCLTSILLIILLYSVYI
jgi:uncharacterized membrane protein